MAAIEKDLATRMLGRVLAEYGQVDDRLGKEFHAIANGNEQVARECLLLMATVHLQGAKALMRAAGWPPKKIAEFLYQQADDEASKR